MKKKLVLVLALAMSLMMFAACAKPATEPSSTEEKPKTDIKFAMVDRNTGQPYAEKQLSGFKEAVEELGYTAIINAPDAPTAEAQIQMIEDLINQNIAGLAVVCNDPDALAPVLKKAMNQGIKVISIDGPALSESRLLHVNQANSELVGRIEVEAMYEMLGGEGQFAILSATAQSAEQNVWIGWMEDELQKEKYKDMELVKIVYGDDLRDKSVSEMEGLLKTYPDLKGVIAPTTVGMAAAGKVITDRDLIGKVKLTGLGLPSEMAEYIKNGACPWMYLWNPVDNGYLAGRAAIALYEETITGAEGEKFDAGRLGEKDIITVGDGTEVMLGAPYRFDAENIDEWKEIY